MTKLEKAKLEHVVRNRLVAIERHRQQIRKEMEKIERYLDAIEVDDGLTEKLVGGTITR